MLDSTRAAQAILDAAYRLPLQNGQPNMAAALEALADQVVPLPNCNTRTDRGRQRMVFRCEILAIAAQLRGGNQATPPDNRNPDCVAAWPDCHDGGYDPRCCRFPKSCSCEVRSTPQPQPHP